MPALNPQVPVFRYGSASMTPGTIDFGQRMGAIYIKNMGPASVFWALDATPVALLGNGQYEQVAGEAVNLDDILCQNIQFVTSAGTADFQVIGVVRGA